MRSARYVLRPKSAAWRGFDPPRLFELSLTVEREGAPLGGNNIQLVLGAPDRPRTGLNEDVLLWLDSGWWATTRNHFALAPCVAEEIVSSAAVELSRLTERIDAGTHEDSKDFWEQVVAGPIEAQGPDYWR